MVGFLLSDDASYVTRALVSVAGGTQSMTEASPRAALPAHVLLSGGNRDIGGAVAARLRRARSEVIRLSHSPGPAGTLVADFDADDSLVEVVRGIPGPIDGVVLSHGVTERATLADLTPVASRRVMDVNLTSMYAILPALARQLDQMRSIVMVSSTAGLDGSRTGVACPRHIEGRMAHPQFTGDRGGGVG